MTQEQYELYSRMVFFSESVVNFGMEKAFEHHIKIDDSDAIKDGFGHVISCMNKIVNGEDIEEIIKTSKSQEESLAIKAVLLVGEKRGQRTKKAKGK